MKCKPKLSFDLLGHNKHNLGRPKVCANFNQALDEFRAYAIYTDGSSKEGNVGFRTFTDFYEESYRLPAEVINYEAELMSREMWNNEWASMTENKPNKYKSQPRTAFPATL